MLLHTPLYGKLIIKLNVSIKLLHLVEMLLKVS